MPLSGPLVDSFGRVHTDMRLSITDRCNLRCLHCLPAEGVTFLPRSELLDFDELARVALACESSGFFYVGVCDHTFIPERLAGAMSTV